MGPDPTLNAFQASRFAKKIFILDTDIVLEAVVTDGLRSSGIRALLTSLEETRMQIGYPRFSDSGIGGPKRVGLGGPERVLLADPRGSALHARGCTW